ncbi:hypothetical protein [Acidiphilium multivorum]|uniref:hypothetical protein n=1 Tax=Acidiphilium multivorum TaxID=62140 RepID=UPI001B8AA7DD|nr:hypothetical protein [Acidiphilium multivorum]MBS3025657.1 hypothetical protein [Acidiphilium multivorum]
MTSSNAVPLRNRPAYTPAQIAARLIFLQTLIHRSTSGHGRGGTREAYRRRPQLRHDLDYRHLFHWQILRGTTAIGIGDAVWLPEIRDLITTLCAEDGIGC